MDPTVISYFSAAGVVLGALCLIGLCCLSAVVIGSLVYQSATRPDRRAWGALRKAVTEQELRDLADSKLRSAGRSVGYEFETE